MLYAHNLTVAIGGFGAPELHTILYADGEYERLVGIGPEKERFVMIVDTSSEKRAVIVVMAAQVVIVDKFALGNITLYLQPSLGERNIDEAVKSGLYLGNRTAVARHHKPSRAVSAVCYRALVGAFFDTYREEYGAIFDVGIELLYGKVAGADIVCSPLPVLVLPYRRSRLIPAYEVYACGIGETTCRVHADECSCTGICTRAVGNHAIAVGRQVIRGKNPRRAVCRHLGTIIYALLRHSFDGCRKEQKKENDNSFHKL